MLTASAAASFSSAASMIVKRSGSAPVSLTGLEYLLSSADHQRLGKALTDSPVAVIQQYSDPVPRQQLFCCFVRLT
ncbi:MAG: hypothetical protein MZV63_22760 [Marinilabiliales bacterium]|nr:hypothetical protein [Marinilabiliales bacterium]